MLQKTVCFSLIISTLSSTFSVLSIKTLPSKHISYESNVSQNNIKRIHTQLIFFFFFQTSFNQKKKSSTQSIVLNAGERKKTWGNRLGDEWNRTDLPCKGCSIWISLSWGRLIWNCNVNFPQIESCQMSSQKHSRGKSLTLRKINKLKKKIKSKTSNVSWKHVFNYLTV